MLNQCWPYPSSVSRAGHPPGANVHHHHVRHHASLLHAPISQPLRALANIFGPGIQLPSMLANFTSHPSLPYMSAEWRLAAKTLQHNYSKLIQESPLAATTASNLIASVPGDNPIFQDRNPSEVNNHQWNLKQAMAVATAAAAVAAANNVTFPGKVIPAATMASKMPPFGPTVTSPPPSAINATTVNNHLQTSPPTNLHHNQHHSFANRGKYENPFFWFGNRSYSKATNSQAYLNLVITKETLLQ